MQFGSSRTKRAASSGPKESAREVKKGRSDPPKPSAPNQPEVFDLKIVSAPGAKTPGKEVAAAPSGGDVGSAVGKNLTVSEVIGWISARDQEVAELEKKLADAEADLARWEVQAKEKIDSYRTQKNEALREAKKLKKALTDKEAELEVARAGQAELEAARGELEEARAGQGETLRIFVQRLLLSGSFTALANDLAGLINGDAAMDALERVAEEVPGLDISKFGYQRLEGAALFSQYASVVRNHLDQLSLLNELASSPTMLNAEQVVECSVDQVSDLNLAFEALSAGVEDVQEEAEVERPAPEMEPSAEQPAPEMEVGPNN